MNKPKYLQALDLRNQGLSYAEIASHLGTKPIRVKEYLYKARHLEKKLAQHRAHDRRYYYKDLEKSRKKSRDYWQKDPARWQRERLGTVIDGKRVTLYHLNKRERPESCELCDRFGRQLYYHHWDNDFNKGIWICLSCHSFVTRIEKGDAEKYLELKRVIGFLEQSRRTTLRAKEILPNGR